MEQFDYGRPNLQKERLDELDTGYDNSERRKSVDVAKSRVKSRDWTSIIHFVVLYSLLVYFLVTNNPHLHSIISGPIASTSPVDVLCKSFLDLSQRRRENTNGQQPLHKTPSNMRRYNLRNTS